MTIFVIKILVQNFTTNILGKVTEAFDLIVQGLRMATKSYIGGHKSPVWIGLRHFPCNIIA